MEQSTMSAKQWLAILTALVMMFGSACFAGLWMNAVGRVSGWMGLPQYESQIPKLRSYGTLWESLTIALLFIAAFFLGLGKSVPSDELPPRMGHTCVQLSSPPWTLCHRRNRFRILAGYDAEIPHRLAENYKLVPTV
jgi:hypothetical protein